MMESLLHGISKVVCYIEDILITGKSHDEHLLNLREVCIRLQKCGIIVKHSKCRF